MARLGLDTVDEVFRFLINEHTVAYRVRPCMPARRRGHRIEEGRRHLPVQPVPRLDQGPQSRQHRGAAGAERDLEQMIRGVDFGPLV
jgi:hypothetical protein